jgi:hypothetical protein
MSAPPFLRVAQRHTQSDERESKTDALGKRIDIHHLRIGVVGGGKEDTDRATYLVRAISPDHEAKQRGGLESVLIAMSGNTRNLAFFHVSDEFIFPARRIG